MELNEIREAMARGYCTGRNEKKILDTDLIWDMAAEVMKLNLLDKQKAVLRTIICKHTSEMLDNPGECDIYPTSKFYNNLIENIIAVGFRKEII